MRVKRIIMLVEFLLMIMFSITAFLFQCLPDEITIKNIIVPLSISLSAGAMVALLIEIPMYLNTRKQQVELLKNSFKTTYISLRQFLKIIDDTFNKPDKLIQEKYLEYNIQLIIKSIYDTLYIDKIYSSLIAKTSK